MDEVGFKALMKRLIIPFIFIFLLSSPILSSGYYIKAVRGTGGNLYMSRGYVDDEQTINIFLVLHSELANESAAHDWEVSFSVLPDREDVSYLVVATDGHLLLDPTEDDDSIISGGEAEGVGTQTFGPFLVWASADPAFGDLIWDIDLYSRDGRDYYAGLVMQWGYGVNPPPSIQGAYGLKDDVLSNSTSGTVPLFAVILTAISVAGFGQLAYTRAYKREVKKTEISINE